MRLFFLIFLVAALSSVQGFGFYIFNVKPNLALSAIIAASFFIESIWQGFLLIVLSAFIFKFSPGFDNGILVFSLVAVAAIIVKKYLPWRYFFGNLILTGFGTLFFYIFLASGLIGSVVFFEELVLNMAFGTLIFAFLSLLWQNKTNEIFLRPN